MDNKRSILAGIMLLFSCALGFSQNTDEASSPEEVISRLFKGMETGDSAMVHICFTANPTMATAFRDKHNHAVLRREESLDDFLKAVGSPHKETWYEETWDLKVSIDGDFAQAWCNYVFYLDNTFSHCGVDAFHLHKGEGGWRIFHLADTRRKTPCEIPEKIKEKHR